MVKVFTPNKGETVRHIDMTKEDRQKHLKDFRAEKEYQKEQKDKRFAAIQERRKNRPGGSGAGINIKVESDK